MKEAKWSLYEKKHFDGLFDNIQQLVRDLVELFPAVVPLQRSICEEEATELQEAAAVCSFRDIAKQQDKWLEEAFTTLGTQRVSEQRVCANVVAALTRRKAVANSTTNNHNSKIANKVSGNQTIQGGQTISL